MKPSPVAGDTGGSMSAWMQRVSTLPAPLGTISQRFLDEESRKSQRLAALARSINLPIYESRQFRLPADWEDLRHYLANVNRDGPPRLFLRLSRGTAVFARLFDVDTDAATKICAPELGSPAFVATISPFHPAVVAGTLLVQRQRTLLELAMGPHHWISDGASTLRDSVIRCVFEFPWISIRYSTTNIDLRARAFRVLRDSLALTTRQPLRELASLARPVYAEFQWHPDEGYRFFECSFASFWTGERQHS